jgi:hypothetical protein
VQTFQKIDLYVMTSVFSLSHFFLDSTFAKYIIEKYSFINRCEFQLLFFDKKYLEKMDSTNRRNIKNIDRQLRIEEKSIAWLTKKIQQSSDLTSKMTDVIG